MALHPVTSAYKKEIQEALKKFGEYSYYDKGADEVMDVNAQRFFDLSIEERKVVFAELKKWKHGGPLLSSLEGFLHNQYLDDMGEEEADEMVGLFESIYE